MKRKLQLADSVLCLIWTLALSGSGQYENHCYAA